MRLALASGTASAQLLQDPTSGSDKKANAVGLSPISISHVYIYPLDMSWTSYQIYPDVCAILAIAIKSLKSLNLDR